MGEGTQPKTHPASRQVKIDPRSIGVGLYQHDVDQKRLQEELRSAVQDAAGNAKWQPIFNEMDTNRRWSIIAQLLCDFAVGDPLKGNYKGCLTGHSVLPARWGL